MFEIVGEDDRGLSATDPTQPSESAPSSPSEDREKRHETADLYEGSHADKTEVPDAANNTNRAMSVDEEADPDSSRPTQKVFESSSISRFFQLAHDTTANPPGLKRSIPNSGDDALAASRQRITASNLAPYRQKVLLALLQVPRGQHTTYGAMAAFLGSSPRAVGNAMRNNPFAPDVPCHRVLAAGGGIGGFGGEWGAGGKIEEKRRLLRAEGVRFDGKGKVVGRVWKRFV